MERGAGAASHEEEDRGGRWGGARAEEVAGEEVAGVGVALGGGCDQLRGGASGRN